jgi:hypothetical protein
MSYEIFNPWAPPLLNGFNPTAPPGCEDDEVGFVWPESNGFQTLTASEARSEKIVINRDIDFRFMCFQWALESVDEGATPGFLYRIKDDAGKYVSDGYIYCFNTPGTFANPWPQFPHITYRANQVIEFDILNAASFPQGVQLMFRGMKRYRTQ